MFCTNHSRESGSERWFNKLFGGQQITGQGKFLLAVFFLGFWELLGAVQRSLNKPSVWCECKALLRVGLWRCCTSALSTRAVFLLVLLLPCWTPAQKFLRYAEAIEVLQDSFPKSWLCTVKRGGERRLWDFVAVQHHHYHLLLIPPRWGCPTSKFCCWSSAAARWPGGAVTSWLASGQVENSVAVVLII